ncbi:RNA polymerase II subunit A domain phosphatase [Cryptococcus wingfieldii CBS 7118]|uniref:RNA polymerase II subunit A C-terminal domain phosphatase n=1 Tax=Cryptococcus wingfieldii CBS 7118 TaxID=1295528 RepID=A0A1E3I1U4_9TREE|nr:RNA polymerase II subunit A domain phosphatase [Cryptococcus wingfieldii CBS 7118]ODN82478.1 RNA polymerase II subunit A domain phosphatase [Cryptococcus wingfieldii CBS 7118]
MSDPPTTISLPPSLPYPVTITRLIANPGDPLRRGSRLLEYSFMSSDQRERISKRRAQGRTADKGKGEIEGDDMVGSWDSLIEGDAVAWKGAKVGLVVEKRDASNIVLSIQQACSHPVQLHGMCGVCGADLTAFNTSQAGPSRHPGGFEIAHDSMGVTVSKNARFALLSFEAQRLENLTRNALLDTRRLSLIVDLDQTIIHTTVDPTVAEWMEQIERQKERDAKTKAGERNPNTEALDDVAKFQIADDLPAEYAKLKSKAGPGSKPVESGGRWYFTKPRPGLQKFLDEMSELYEMHVYTMGTRTYADAICQVIDPDGKIFGGRILSRDESGSFSSKNLKRLFPTDTSMVVVIDDRSDVWGDCPNLVKVVPYDFFLGIGDINSSFLPANKSTPPPSSAAKASPAPSGTSPSPPSPSLTVGESAASTPSPTTPSSVTAEVEPTREEELVMKAKLMDEVSSERPLAKLQEELEHAGEGEGGEKGVKESSTRLVTSEEFKERSSSPSKVPKPLLNPHDYELIRVAEILTEIHGRFYSGFDAIENWKPTNTLPMNCDVEFIIPEIKAEVLEGCTLVFSGMIPREVNPANTTIWQTAESFGALITPSLTPRTTHLVTAVFNTEKTWRASKMPHVSTVWGEWFWDSVALWKRQDEGKYLAKKEGSEPEKEEKKGGQVAESQPEGGAEQRKGEGGEENKDMNDDTQVGTGWDEEAEKEWEDFMAGEDDWSEDGSVAASEAGSVRSIGSAPSTPSRKRVRYADEEFLPLEDFKDPSPQDSLEPESKRRKPLLLEDAKPGEDIPEANRMQYKAKGSYGKGKDEAKGEQGETGTSGVEDDSFNVGGGEGDDEFAQMLMDSLADGEEVEDEDE